MTRYEMIKSTNGKIFTVVFRKRDGSLRTMNARVGVGKNVKGIGLAFDPKSRGLITVYDVKVGGHRMISLRKLKSFKCGKMEWRAR